jgi:hypothetical protein
MNKGSQAAKSEILLFPQPALQLIYDTAPIGLACLSPDPLSADQPAAHRNLRHFG